MRRMLIRFIASIVRDVIIETRTRWKWEVVHCHGNDPISYHLTWADRDGCEIMFVNTADGYTGTVIKRREMEAANAKD